MAKRKPQPTTQRQRESNTLTVKAVQTGYATGHQSHITGTGAHDSRPKRQRTRNAQRRAWRREWD